MIKPQAKEENLEKCAPTIPTEEYLRSLLREEARTRFHDQDLHLSGEVIGIACQITGIDDPANAISELVDAAINRWARLQVIERMIPDSEPRGTRSMLKRSPKETKKQGKAKGRARK
jgi:hypothetical protein